MKQKYIFCFRKIFCCLEKGPEKPRADNVDPCGCWKIIDSKVAKNSLKRTAKIAPANESSPKNSSRIIFQPSIFRSDLLVSGRPQTKKTPQKSNIDTKNGHIQKESSFRGCMGVWDAFQSPHEVVFCFLITKPQRCWPPMHRHCHP